MSGDVDFTKGGYGGDPFEESFKYFTAQHMEWWWQFREVLLASDEESDNWVDQQGIKLGEGSQRKLVALSMTHHAVYVGVAEALTFFYDMTNAVSKRQPFEAKRHWKAAYSSLYTSFVAICNILCVVLEYEKCKKPPKNNNYSYRHAKKLCNPQKQYGEFHPLLERCNENLEIRNHLDHYWTIWTKLDRQEGKFYMDSEFKKGCIRLTRAEGTYTIDVPHSTYEHIVDIAESYDTIYKKLSLQGKYLDKYISNNNWFMRYGNGKRPTTRADNT